MFCTKCGSQLGQGLRFCPTCGEAIPSVFAPPARVGPPPLPASARANAPSVPPMIPAQPVAPPSLPAQAQAPGTSPGMANPQQDSPPSVGVPPPLPASARRNVPPVPPAMAIPYQATSEQWDNVRIRRRDQEKSWAKPALIALAIVAVAAIGFAVYMAVRGNPQTPSAEIASPQTSSTATDMSPPGASQPAADINTDASAAALQAAANAVANDATTSAAAAEAIEPADVADSAEEAADAAVEVAPTSAPVAAAICTTEQVLSDAGCDITLGGEWSPPICKPSNSNEDMRFLSYPLNGTIEVLALRNPRDPSPVAFVDQAGRAWNVPFSPQCAQFRKGTTTRLALWMRIRKTLLDAEGRVTPGPAPYSFMARISDPDGFTNIRASPAPQAARIARIFDGERFQTYPQDSDWWKVRTIRGTVGYMPGDRIQIIDPHD